MTCFYQCFVRPIQPLSGLDGSDGSGSLGVTQCAPYSYNISSCLLLSTSPLLIVLPSNCIRKHALHPSAYWTSPRQSYTNPKAKTFRTKPLAHTFRRRRAGLVVQRITGRFVYIAGTARISCDPALNTCSTRNVRQPPHRGPAFLDVQWDCQSLFGAAPRRATVYIYTRYSISHDY